LKRHAFTLVELLTVTAIIALLATILFPVFARAKTPPQQLSVENIQRLEYGELMYCADHDDTRGGRQNVDGSVCEGWRQIIYPYVRSERVYRDFGNESSDFRDVFSIPATREILCEAGTTPLRGLPPLSRGYYWNNVFHVKQISGDNFDNAGMPLSEVESLGTTGDIVEGRSIYDDDGPFVQGWVDNIDADTSWFGSSNPVTGLFGSNLSGKYGGRGEDASYMDGHVRPTMYIEICNQFANVGADAANCRPSPTQGLSGCVDPAPIWRGDPRREGFWNFSENDIKNSASFLAAGVAQYCTSMPPQNQ
jgi:prepilin-type N-terminal cleavage/methylation domain-containing protein